MTQRQHNDSPLQIVTHYVSRFELNASPEVHPDSVFFLNTKRTVQALDSGERTWQVVLEVDLRPEDPTRSTPYTAQIIYTGIFTVVPEYPTDKVSDLVAVTGASILYGAAREMIANVSSRSSRGMITLPSITFAKLGTTPPKKDDSSMGSPSLEDSGRGVKSRKNSKKRSKNIAQ